MASSGNTIKVLNQSQIINAALRKLGVLAEGGTASAAQVTTSQEALNALVSEFRTLGMNVWARAVLNITLVPNQFIYNIGVGQTINTPYPMSIYDIQLEQGPVFYDTFPMNQYAIVDFNRLPPNSFGTPVNYNYQPKINTGTLMIWPTPDASTPANTRMVVTYQRPFEVFDTAVNDMDFPQEWGNALIYHLALSLADEYGVPDSKHQRIAQQAAIHLGIANSASNEEGSLYMQRDWEGF